LKIFLPAVAYTALACLLAVSAPPICQAQSYTITTVAGGGNTGASGDSIGDGGPATSAYLLPTGVAVDSAGNLYIADPSNNIIRKVTTDGLISTIAGDAVGRTFGNSGDGGPATTALLNHPQDVALDSAGNLYISDTGNATIRMVSTAGIITTVAGPSGLAWPAGIAVDSTGALYIADRDANNVRKVTPDGAITTVAGCLVCLSLGDGGAATKAPLSMPFSVAVDSAGARQRSRHQRRVEYPERSRSRWRRQPLHRRHRRSANSHGDSRRYHHHHRRQWRPGRAEHAGSHGRWSSRNPLLRR
jgi:hypothetical protein